MVAGRRHILVVEDNPGDARLVREVFRDATESAHAGEATFHTSEVTRVAEAKEFLAREQVDLVLLDLALPDSEGIDTFVRVRDVAPDVPIVVFTGNHDMSVAIRAVREGAQDYITKNELDVTTLLRSVRYATERKQAERDRAALVREQAARAEAEAQRSHLDALTRELRSRERKLRAIFDGARDAMLIADDERRYVDANKAAEELFGISRDELLARRVDDVMLPFATPEAVAAGWEAFRREGTSSGEIRILRADGATLNVEFGSTGDILPGLHLSVLRDVTARTARDVELARAMEEGDRERQRAEEANRAKDEFLATVSHELRTPLNAMLGWARMLKAGTLPEEKKASAVAAIERNAVAQAQLIDDILDVSRIISGKLRVELLPISPGSVVHTAVEALRPTAEAKGVKLVATLAPECRTVHGDADRLQQILWNLLSNAIKFTPSGGTIEASVVEADEHVELRVRDTGRGIAADFLPHVFERFRQADSAPSRAHGGLGLGLAIVRHLVELHGGTVDVESDGPGLGATFTVRLPSRVAPSVAAVAPASAPPSEAPPGSLTELPSLAGLRVLVVDDEVDARELTSMVLTQAGALVGSAASVGEALARLREARVDVLVSDLAMPGEDGFALIAKIRAGEIASAAELPAAALTAYARAEDARRAVAAGFDVHAAKPVDPAKLVALVATLAGRVRNAP